MNFYKTTFFTLISTGINLICGIIMVKISYKIIGAEGSAIIGQFTNMVSIFSLISTGSISAGVIKYAAEYKNDEAQFKKYISNALYIVLFCSVLTAIFILFTYNWFVLKAFRNNKFDGIFILYAIVLIVNNLNGVLSGILNGLQEIKRMTLVSIYSSVAGLAVSIILVVHYGVYGSLLSMIVMQVLIFIFTFFLFTKFSWFNWDILKNRVDYTIIKHYLSYSSGIVIELTIPFVLLYVRNLIMTRLSLSEAGYWQSMNIISDRYMGLVYTVLGVYYLPKLSSLQDKGEILKEIKWGFYRIIPSMAIFSFFIWFLKIILYTYCSPTNFCL